MNRDDALDPQPCKEDIAGSEATNSSVVLHRLTEVRRALGIPRRVLARRLGTSVRELRAKEKSADLTLGTLCQWAAALNVPVTELVVERDECLAPTHLAQAQATRLMKVAAKLRDRARRRSVQRLAQTFVEQLAEILPVLEQLAQKNHCRSRRPSQSPASLPSRMSEDVFTRRRESEER